MRSLEVLEQIETNSQVSAHDDFALIDAGKQVEIHNLKTGKTEKTHQKEDGCKAQRFDFTDRWGSDLDTSVEDFVFAQSCPDHFILREGSKGLSILKTKDFSLAKNGPVYKLFKSGLSEVKSKYII